MFKKFARWILADEIANEAVKLDIARARVEAESARADEIHADFFKAESVIAKVFFATSGVKNGTGKKVHRMIQDYYDAPSLP